METQMKLVRRLHSTGKFKSNMAALAFTSEHRTHVTTLPDKQAFKDFIKHTATHQLFHRLNLDGTFTIYKLDHPL